jgi:hypothetical protein
MPAFVYLLGVLLVVGAAAYGAMLVGVPTTWITIGAVILAGIGIMATAGYMRRRTVVDTTGVAPTTTAREITYTTA